MIKPLVRSEHESLHEGRNGWSVYDEPVTAKQKGFRVVYRWKKGCGWVHENIKRHRKKKIKTFGVDECTATGKKSSGI